MKPVKTEREIELEVELKALKVSRKNKRDEEIKVLREQERLVKEAKEAREEELRVPLRTKLDAFVEEFQALQEKYDVSLGFEEYGPVDNPYFYIFSNGVEVKRSI